MFAITIRERSGQDYTFHFDKPEVLIGRVKGNDVILPKQNISKRHTMVRTAGKRFTVEDLGSTNGTYVNGHRITSAVEIGPDDKVYLGDFVMTFMDLSAVAGQGLPEPPAVPDFPAVPDLPDLAASGEAGANMRATLHMSAPPSIPTPAEPVASELPPIEPLDMPAELVQQPPPEGGLGVDFLDRLTGPLESLHGDGLHAAGGDLGAAASALAAIPGLAGAIKAPSKPQNQAPAVAPLPESRPASQPKPAIAPAHQPAAVPTPAASAAAPAAPAEGGYHDRLAGLFREAMQELRPSLPTDTTQMSDSDWTELEDRVTNFVDRAVAAGAMAAGDDPRQVCRDLIYELTGFGPLEPMLDDPTIESIEVNGHDQLHVVRDGRRERASERFSCQAALALAVDRLVRATGQSARGGTQMEGTLVDGTSVYVVWPPACPFGPAVVLRKPRAEAPELELLVARGTVSAHAAEVLARLVGERRSVAIVGPHGVGKRTVLNALGLVYTAGARLAVFEDGQRLRLPSEQVVRIDTALLGDGGVTALQVALRLRPDAVLFGDAVSLQLHEVFAVAADALPTWLGVFIARDADDFVHRAMHALQLEHPGLTDSVARARVLRSLDAVAVFVKDVNGNHVLSQICEVTRAQKGDAALVEVVPGIGG